MMYAFERSFAAYREAHRRCQVETGNALSAAHDQEAVAIKALTAARSEVLGEIGDKLDVLKDLMKPGRWSDERDLDLLDSIRRDVKAMVRRDLDKVTTFPKSKPILHENWGFELHEALEVIVQQAGLEPVDAIWALVSTATSVLKKTKDNAYRAELARHYAGILLRAKSEHDAGEDQEGPRSKNDPAPREAS
jgi:hypothetical protein